MADLTIEPELLWGQRAFAKAQELLRGETVTRLPDVVEVGWHGSSISPLRGAFAVVRRDGPLSDLVGDTLRVTAGERSVFVYVVSSSLAVPNDLSLSSRAFFALARLTDTTVPCAVETVA